jgi:hypothetical protein
MTGVLAGVNAVTGGSSLFVYTDASSKDRYLSEMVGSLAASRKIVLNYVVSGSCSPIDPAYYDTASRTGGALMLAYNTELATPFLRALSSKNNRLVFSAFDTLANDSRRYRVNVDSAATQLTLVVGTDEIQGIRLIDPDGVDVTHNPAITNLVDFYSGATLFVSAPNAGEWTFEYTGTGKSFTNAYVLSPVSILALDPVQQSGRLGHEGMFPVIGSPVLGDDGRIEVTMKGASADQLEVRRLNGELVSAHPFSAEEGENLGEGVYKYHADVTFDSTPVRFFLRGKDANGVAFLRAYPTSYAAQPLKVSVQDAAFQLEPGHRKTVNFVVENRGPDATVQFRASASPNYIDATFAPSNVRVLSGSSAVVGVPLTVPADTQLDQVSVIFTASDEEVPARANSSVVQLIVGSKDSDGDGVVDESDQCPASVLEATVHVDACDSGTTNHLFPEGCTISDEVGTLRSTASNHGQFVSATAGYTHDLIDLGVLNNKDASSIVNCAAKAKTP